ncbi:MAG: TadE/TadG family type IV pilus assembly protein [Chloroflexales bacterium]
MGSRHRSYGQSLVEMSLVLPLLLLIIFGLVDFGLAYTTNVLIRGAVAEGGYYASQHPGDAQGVRDRITSELSDLSPAVTDSDITINECVSGSSGPQTEIIVAYTYHVIFGLAGSGPTITLRNGTVVPQFGAC